MSIQPRKFQPRKVDHQPAGGAKRKCNACCRTFTPTASRRMLCNHCYKGIGRTTPLPAFELEW